MHSAQRPRQDPFIFRLISLFFDDQMHENGDAKPLSDRTVAFLMVLGVVAGFLFGLAWGVIPQ
jgi:hypothetical protein